MNRNDFRTLGQLFRRNNRRTSFGMLAYVTQVGPEPNQYLGRLDDTRGIVSFAGPKDQVLAINQPVLLARPDIAGRMLNGGYIYLGLPPMHARNTTTSNEPDDQTETTTAEIITSIPEYVELTAGGASVQVLIYGKNLATAPTYGEATITDASAQVITSTLITLTVSASIACNAGEYSLTVAGVTYPRFFRVSTERPDLSDFTWENQGPSTATQATSSAPIIVSTSYVASSYEWIRLLTKPPASSSATFTVGIVANLPTSANAFAGAHSCGIVIKNTGENDNGVAIGIWRYGSLTGGGSPFLRVTRWGAIDGEVAPGILYDGIASPISIASEIYLRIENDGTNLILSWSSDGETFTTLHTTTLASWITSADACGFYVVDQRNEAAPSMTVYKWVETP